MRFSSRTSLLVFFGIFVLGYILARDALLQDAPLFSDRIDCGVVESVEIEEASGLVASRINPDVLWIHNDSGGRNVLYALDIRGGFLGMLHIPGADARDWEDIAIGPGPEAGKSYLFIGDIGNNLSLHEQIYIYRVPEPSVRDLPVPFDIDAGETECITLRYPDGRRDAETLLVDPITRDIYIVTKRETNVGVYRAAYPQSTSIVVVPEKVATIPLTDIVGGDIAPDGGELLLKTYDDVFLWRIDPSRPLSEALNETPEHLPYRREPQGEAIAWDRDAGGYYTISEKSGSRPVYLYFYERLTGGSAED